MLLFIPTENSLLEILLDTEINFIAEINHKKTQRVFSGNDNEVKIIIPKGLKLKFNSIFKYYRPNGEYINVIDFIVENDLFDFKKEMNLAFTFEDINYNLNVKVID